MIKEHTKKMLNHKISLDISYGPNFQYFLLPVLHIEVDCVKVGYHHGGVQDVVEEYQDRKDQVGDVNISMEIKTAL